MLVDFDESLSPLQRGLAKAMINLADSAQRKISFEIRGTLERIIAVTFEDLTVCLYSDGFDIQGYKIDERYEADDLRVVDDAENLLIARLLALRPH